MPDDDLNDSQDAKDLRDLFEVVLSGGYALDDEPVDYRLGPRGLALAESWKGIWRDYTKSIEDVHTGKTTEADRDARIAQSSAQGRDFWGKAFDLLSALGLGKPDPDLPRPYYTPISEVSETPAWNQPEQNTQEFWMGQFLDRPMPSARNEQEYKKELEDYYGELEREQGLEERPDDWAVKGTKRGSLDRMPKDAPSYYPVPGDVLKDEHPFILEDRPWMKPGPMTNVSWGEFADPKFDAYLKQQKAFEDILSGTQILPDDPPDELISPRMPLESLKKLKLEHAEDYQSTQPFWTDTLLNQPMPAGDTVIELFDPEIKQLPPLMREEFEEAPSEREQWDRSNPTDEAPYAPLPDNWDYFPLA